MAQSYLIFDFGTNEEAAQQARHKLEGWKQAFRLNKKLQLKFEREEIEEAGGDERPAEKEEPGKGKRAEPESDAQGRIRLILKLDFSDHDRLSHQRWLERIPTEEPFKSASPQIVRYGEANFDGTAELFDMLD